MDAKALLLQMVQQAVQALLNWQGSWPSNDMLEELTIMKDGEKYLMQAGFSWTDPALPHEKGTPVGFWVIITMSHSLRQQVDFDFIRLTGDDLQHPLLVECEGVYDHRGVGVLHEGYIDPQNLQAGVKWHLISRKEVMP